MERTDNKTVSDKQKSKRPNSSLVGGLAFKLLGVILAGIWMGYLIDDKLGLHIPIFTLAGALFSLAAVIVYLIRQTK